MDSLLIVSTCTHLIRVPSILVRSAGANTNPCSFWNDTAKAATRTGLSSLTRRPRQLRKDSSTAQTAARVLIVSFRWRNIGRPSMLQTAGVHPQLSSLDRMLLSIPHIWVRPKKMKWTRIAKAWTASIRCCEKFGTRHSWMMPEPSGALYRHPKLTIKWILTFRALKKSSTKSTGLFVWNVEGNSSATCLTSNTGV